VVSSGIGWHGVSAPRDLLLTMSNLGRNSTAAMLARACFVVVLVPVHVFGSRLVLARGWHDQYLTRIGWMSAGVFDRSAAARVHQSNQKAEDRREFNSMFVGSCLEAPGHLDRFEYRAVDVGLFVFPK
jgi:hypothetical protein